MTCLSRERLILWCALCRISLRRSLLVGQRFGALAFRELKLWRRRWCSPFITWRKIDTTFTKVFALHVHN